MAGLLEGMLNNNDAMAFPQTDLKGWTSDY